MRSTTSSSGTCSSNHVVAGLQTRSFSSIIAAAFRGLACSAGLSPALWGGPDGSCREARHLHSLFILRCGAAILPNPLILQKSGSGDSVRAYLLRWEKWGQTGRILLFI